MGAWLGPGLVYSSKFHTHSVAHPTATAQFVEHARRDDARGQGDDGDAHERGDHGDRAPHVGGGVEVAVADGRQGDDSPVDGVKERVEGVRLDIEDDEGADEDVADRQAEDGEQRLSLFLENGGDG